MVEYKETLRKKSKPCGVGKCEPCCAKGYVRVIWPVHDLHRIVCSSRYLVNLTHRVAVFCPTELGIPLVESTSRVRIVGDGLGSDRFGQGRHGPRTLQRLSMFGPFERKLFGRSDVNTCQGNFVESCNHRR